MAAPLFIFFAALLWSTDSWVRLPVSQAFGSTSLVLLEHVGGLLLFLPFLAWKGRRLLPRVSRRDWGLFALLGLSGSAAGNYFYTKSVGLIGPSAPNLFLLVQPLIVLGLATTFLRERISTLFFQLAIWVVLNAIIIAFPDLSFGFQVVEEGDLLEGSFWALAAVAAYSVSTVVGKALLVRHDPFFVVGMRWTFAMFGVLLTQGLFGNAGGYSSGEGAGPVDWAGLGYLSWIAGMGAMALYYRGLKSTPLSLAAFIELIYPVGGMFFPLVISGQPISFVQIIAAITLLVTLYLQWLVSSQPERR